MTLIDEITLKTYFLTYDIENIPSNIILNIMEDQQFKNYKIKNLNLFYISRLVCETVFPEYDLDKIKNNCKKYLQKIIQESNLQIEENILNLYLYFIFTSIITRNNNFNNIELLENIKQQIETIIQLSLTEKDGDWFVLQKLKFLLLRIYNFLLYTDNTINDVNKITSLITDLEQNKLDITRFDNLINSLSITSY